MIIVCVVGPTASGKSELAEHICRAMDGELVSADSMQIYRGMDIGTAKVPRERRSVPYHCIDMRDPGESYSAALYQADSRTAVRSISGRGRLPVLCGGTGLYVRAAVDDMDFAAGAQEGNNVRERYTELSERIGANALHELLTQRDPESARLIHPNNVRRVIRAFEMLEEGESYAQRKRRFRHIPPLIPNVKIGIRVDPHELNRRIDTRVDAMVSAGLVEEVESLLAAGFREGLTAPQAIGYKEIVSCLDGACTLTQACDDIRTATRRYAKRQRTWFRSDGEIHWIDGDAGVTSTVVRQALEVASNAIAAG